MDEARRLARATAQARHEAVRHPRSQSVTLDAEPSENVGLSSTTPSAARIGKEREMHALRLHGTGRGDALDGAAKCARRAGEHRDHASIRAPPANASGSLRAREEGRRA